MLNCWTHSTTTRNYAVNYYKTLEEVPKHLGMKELKKLQKIQKAWKKMWKLVQTLRVLAIGFSSTATGESTRGLMEREWTTVEWGEATARW